MENSEYSVFFKLTFLLLSVSQPCSVHKVPPLILALNADYIATMSRKYIEAKECIFKCFSYIVLKFEIITLQINFLRVNLQATEAIVL